MNHKTLLLRQINPSWNQNGIITSQAFRATPKDEKLLSVYDGDQITYENSWKHFTEELKLKSDGVKAVSVEECAEFNLNVIPDPETFKEHCLIDFSKETEGEIKKKAKKLKAYAVKRGWLFQP